MSGFLLAAVFLSASGCDNKPREAEARQLFRKARKQGDAAKARKLFIRSCGMGYAPACRALGAFDEFSTPAEKAFFFGRACKLGDCESCTTAARVLFKQADALIQTDEARFKHRVKALLAQRSSYLERTCESDKSSVRRD